MKKLVALSLLLVGFSSYALLPEGKFKGTGTWKTPEKGHAGTWVENSVVKADGKDFILLSHLQILHNGVVMQEEKSETRFVFLNEGFFAVKRGNVQIGAGYCYGALCHYDFKISDKEMGEETIHVHAGALDRMGSTWGENDGHKFHVAYSGKSVRE